MATMPDDPRCEPLPVAPETPDSGGRDERPELAELTELAQELAALGKQLAQAVGGSRRTLDGKPATVALARILPQLDAHALAGLSEDPVLRDWLAVPLTGETYPFLVHLQKRLEDLSYKTDHDTLTGLLNRRAFDRILEQELNRARRQHTRLAVAVIDVDDFKRVNDVYGHPCGDKVLAALGRTVDTNTRAYDAAARIGGEEFAIILPGSGPHKSRALLERLLSVFRETPFHCEGHDPFHATFSVGLAFTKGASPQLTPTALVQAADKALYRAKKKGKNTVELVKMEVEEVAPKATMVQSDEKRFLFG